MGNSVASEENKQWALEHVLFFDPETRPDPDAVLDERGGGGGGGRVKRFTPSNAKLCNRNFLIRFTVEGKKREFILKMQNQPQCRLLLSDKAGEPIKEIRTSKIKYVQKQNVTVEVYVRTGLQETSSLSFEFENAKECDLFAEFLRMLFGIQVHHFGYREAAGPQHHQNKDYLKKFNSDDSSSDSSESSDEDDYNRRRKMEMQQRRERQKALQSRTGCPVHGDKPCRCTIERPTLTHQGGGVSSDEEEEVEASHTDQYPVAIEGLCEAGSSVKMKDLAARLVNRAPPRVIEWFFSHRPGKNPTFSTTPDKTGPACRLEESHVGLFLQLRVARRIENTSAANPFVYSLALKGPITVGSETARGMLEILSETETDYSTTLTNEDLHVLFELPPKSVANTRPFFDCTLTLTRTGTRFVSKVRDFDQPLYREAPWAYFYVSRPEEVDYREDDLSLCFHLMNYSARTGGYFEKVVTLRLPSQGVRDFVFHTIVFFRLSKKVTAFERCSRDLETSNFTPIKQRYARLWAENSWEDYATLPFDSVVSQYPGSYTPHRGLTPGYAGGQAPTTPGYPDMNYGRGGGGGAGVGAIAASPAYPSPQLYNTQGITPNYYPYADGGGAGAAEGMRGGGGLAPPGSPAGRGGVRGRNREGGEQKSNYSVYAQYMNQGGMGFGGIDSIIGQVDNSFQGHKPAGGGGGRGVGADGGGAGGQAKRKA
ncbi:hypothetical protein CSUI_006545 [Cystoisospora suis]|uniref:Uncharacterized protein n=1 Tax=Cystoisospora suis TaxID=483139 RepID=A0A2C6KU40_9APIC|nr:hypothetical protein CSUI_006545 [Cystoisospora suis]